MARNRAIAIARGRIVGDDTSFFKMVVHREDRRLLGVPTIGTGATEFLHIGRSVIRLRGALAHFLPTALYYPTLSECHKVAAMHAGNDGDVRRFTPP